MRGNAKGRIVQRGRFFHVVYYAPKDGRARQVWESSHSEDREVAEQLLEKRLHEIRNHREGVRPFAGAAAERLTINAILDSLEADWRQRGIKSLRQSINHAKPIREAFGLRRAVTITTDSVRKYIEQRKADGKSDAKINRETEILASAFRLALREEKLAKMPYIPHRKESNVRQGFFELAEHQQMLEHLEQPANDISRLAFLCGWRLSELRLLRFENIDARAKEIRLADSKNGRPRVLPIPDDATWEIFERRLDARAYETPKGPALSEFVFHEYGQPVSESKFKRLWSRARKKASLPHRLFHDYRRSAARNMIRAGVPEVVCMQVTGHVTSSMLKRYCIVSVDDQRNALTKSIEFLKQGAGTTSVSKFRKSEESKDGSNR